MRDVHQAKVPPRSVTGPRRKPARPGPAEHPTRQLRSTAVLHAGLEPGPITRATWFWRPPWDAPQGCDRSSSSLTVPSHPGCSTTATGRTCSSSHILALGCVLQAIDTARTGGWKWSASRAAGRLGFNFLSPGRDIQEPRGDSRP